MTECLLCTSTGGELLWQNEQMRVIDAVDPMYPGFTRVIWTRHVAEMTDLNPTEQLCLMQVVLQVERTQRETLRPDKINLAALGNLVPHLHWHIIPRWRDDAHFPQPVWASLPEADPPALERQNKQRAIVSAMMHTYHSALIKALTTNLSSTLKT